MAAAWNVNAAKLSSAVERRSNGRLRIELYPSGQLAKEQESVNGLITGNVAFLESIAPRLAVLELPFLFKDEAAVFRVLDGPIGDDLFADLEAKGIVGLMWGSAGGFRELELTSRMVRVPADLKGLRIRIQNGAVYVAMMQSLGAIPVVIDASERIVALQQHTVDGLDISLEQIVTQAIYPYISHVALTNHIYSLQPLVASKKSLDALPPDLRQILRSEARSIRSAQRRLGAERVAETARFMREKGITFNEIDYPAFRRAMDPVYAGFESKLGGDLIERVSRAANSA